MDEKNEQELLETETDALTVPESEALPEESGADESAEEEPRPDMVFGMKRRTFHLVVVGYALGMIFISILAMNGLYPEEGSTLVPGVIGGIFGYLLARMLDKRDAQNEQKP